MRRDIRKTLFDERSMDTWKSDSARVTNQIKVKVCVVCSRVPAAQIILKRHVGLLVFHRTFTFAGDLCGDCASVEASLYQRQTAVQGWTSPSSLIANPFTLAFNRWQRRSHQKALEQEIVMAQRSPADSRPIPQPVNSYHQRKTLREERSHKRQRGELPES